MAIATTEQLPVNEHPAGTPPAGKPTRSRWRPWMIAPVVILLLGLGAGSYYAFLIRDAFSAIHARTTPPAVISGSALGGSASTTIDTGAAKTAVAQAAAGIETPTISAPLVATASTSEATSPPPTATDAITATATVQPTVQPAETAPIALAAAPIQTPTAIATAVAQTLKATATTVAQMPSPAAAAPIQTSKATATAPIPTSTETATARVNVPSTPTATATPAVVLSDIERVANGDLEQGADGWYLNEDAAVSGDHVHGGRGAIVIGVHGGYASQRVFSVPGASYQLSVWVQLSAPGTPGEIGVLFLDANGAKLAPAKPAPAPFAKTAWTKVILNYTVPNNAAAAEIYFWKPASASTFDIDDASVRGFVSSETAMPGTAAASDSHSMNLLLMGVDARPGEAIDSGVRPDSLMVLHLDAQTGSCRVLAIPRDTRTELPGYGLSKINHALAVGGVDYEKLVVQNLLGLKINHFVLIDFNGFQSLVDAVGGVTVNVPADFTSTDGTVFTTGVQSMTGQQALSYARFRGGPDGDFGRIDRQQQVLRALVARASGLNVVRSLNELLPAVKANLRTDLSAQDMASIASDYRSRCTPDKVAMLTLDGGIATYQDPLLNLPLSYVIVDPAEIKAKVAELLGR